MKTLKSRTSLIRSFFINSLLVVLLFQMVSCKKSDPGPTYSRVAINRVTIQNFPGDNAGSTWDNALNGYDPDVYFQITNSGTSNVLYTIGSGNRVENLTSSDIPYGWFNSNGSAIYTCNNLNQAIDIDLWDYDYATSDEYMGSATCLFSNYTSGSNKYPSTVNVTNGSVSIQLELAWMP